MVLRNVIVVTVFAALFSVTASPETSAQAKCTSAQAQCAVEIGGTCDPQTGRWQYGGGYLGTKAGTGGTGASGGTNRFGAFDACVARKLAERKQRS
jgi:poly(3-hydroxybutyrate) depolymerase